MEDHQELMAHDAHNLFEFNEAMSSDEEIDNYCAEAVPKNWNTPFEPEEKQVGPATTEGQIPQPGQDS